MRHIFDHVMESGHFVSRLRNRNGEGGLSSLIKITIESQKSSLEAYLETL